MTPPAGVVTYLFTDIEGSTRLWEEEPERMRVALARHDALAREAVAAHAGTLVKTTGDGIHAAFDDPLDAVETALALQLALTGGDEALLKLDVRCGVHMGPGERRDGDFYGPEVNRAARIMGVAHGGQVLVSQPVALLVGTRLRDGATLRALGELRLRDIAGTEQVFQLAHPKLRAEFPPLRSLASTPTNLPQQLTSFVGREAALAEVVELTRRTRLVTLVGPGGIGKTRLSLEAAASMLDTFPDGVFVVELAAIGDARLVAQAVATVLGVKEEAGKPVVEALMKHLAGRRTLLVLDNCEHLVQGCADLATALLRASASLHILASSREALAIRGEQVYAVPALSLPAAPAQSSRARDDGASRRFLDDALRGSEAARLFIERAVAARADYEVAGEDGPAIIEICQRLDGIPLAIELAAARTRTMPVPRIAERLSDRFRLLTGGDRSAMPRQQTLRALIDWSVDLLDARERALLRRLSVFAGGFAVDAAAEVVSGEALDAGEVEDMLARLAEKSLLTFEQSSGRYGMLDTVRDYAAEKLVDAGEEAAVRDRHLDWMIATTGRVGKAFFGTGQREAIATLDVERQNLLAAHRWCDRADAGAARGLRLVEPTKMYWFMRGLFDLGLTLAVESLSRGEVPGAGRSRARLCLAAGQFASWMGRYDEALKHLDGGLALARALGDEALVGTLLQPLAMAELGHGDRRAAREHVNEALQIVRRQGGGGAALAAALNQVGQIDRIDGRHARASAHFEEALAAARAAADAATEAVTLLNLAMVAVGEGRHARSATMVAAALSIAESKGDSVCRLASFDVASALAAARDEPRMAAHFHGVAEAMLREIGGARDPVDSAFLAEWLERARARLTPSAFDLAGSAAAARAPEVSVDELRAWLAAAMADD